MAQMLRLMVIRPQIVLRDAPDRLSLGGVAHFA